LGVSWPPEVDEILGGDHVVAMAHRTPAQGVVLTPLTNFLVRDRERGVAENVNSSVAMWSKLARVRDDPQVALAFHTRDHASHGRPEYVLVQGRASLTPLDDRGYLDRIRDQWEQAAGPVSSGFWGWLQEIYYWRVGLPVDVERIVVWNDLRCGGQPAVHGAPLPADPSPQAAPKKGTRPRVGHEQLAEYAQRLPHTLLGWVGADGFPVVVPVEAGEVSERGVALRSAAGLPPGGRRAGLTAHWFGKHAIGQEQRRYTGWLDDGVYAPHTLAGYRMPKSKVVFKLGAGIETRRRYREARKRGFVT
jgi:hypothetical protein